jgi:hypothetical protein
MQTTKGLQQEYPSYKTNGEKLHTQVHNDDDDDKQHEITKPPILSSNGKYLGCENTVCICFEI